MKFNCLLFEIFPLYYVKGSKITNDILLYFFKIKGVDINNPVLHARKHVNSRLIVSFKLGESVNFLLLPKL